MSQTYRNDEQVNIEAVYTFPLPLDAVLLDLQVEIGGRILKGVVVEKKAAEEAKKATEEAKKAADEARKTADAAAKIAPAPQQPGGQAKAAVGK